MFGFGECCSNARRTNRLREVRQQSTRDVLIANVKIVITDRKQSSLEMEIKIREKDLVMKLVEKELRKFKRFNVVQGGIGKSQPTLRNFKKIITKIWQKPPKK